MFGQLINGIRTYIDSGLYAYAGMRFADGNFGWRDLRGHFVVPTSGTTAGSREQFKTGVYEQGYNATDIQDWGLHLAHDLVQGGDKFLHLHTKLGAGGTAGGADMVVNVTIGYYRHNRTGSPAPITKTFTITADQQNTAQNGTLVTEVLIAQSGGGAGLFNSLVDWIPDDDIGVSLVVISIFGTITGTSPANAKVGIPHVDIHEQALWSTSPRRVISNNSFWN